LQPQQPAAEQPSAAFEGAGLPVDDGAELLLNLAGSEPAADAYMDEHTRTILALDVGAEEEYDPEHPGYDGSPI
jgi:hypothetical protein